LLHRFPERGDDSGGGGCGCTGPCGANAFAAGTRSRTKQLRR
jgi:hypothetical protein